MTELGYLRLGVSSLSRWKEYATEILPGFECCLMRANPRRCYLRMDSWHHRFILEEDGSDDLNALGLRVAGQEEFAEMHRRLTGWRLQGSRDRLARTRGRSPCARNHDALEDPSGNPIEIFHGPHVQYGKPVPSRPAHVWSLRHRHGGHGPLPDPEQRLRRHVQILHAARHARRQRHPIPHRATRTAQPASSCSFPATTGSTRLGFGVGVEKRINHVMIEAKSASTISPSPTIWSSDPADPDRHRSWPPRQRSSSLFLLFRQPVRMDVRICLGLAPGLAAVGVLRWRRIRP